MSATPAPESIALYYTEGSSDKEYRVQLVETSPGQWMALGFNGRRGQTLKEQKKTPTPVDYATAKATYDKTVKSKLKDGYTPEESGAIYQNSGTEKEFSGFVPQQLNSLRTPEQIEAAILNPALWAQEKHDGQRRPIFRPTEGKISGTNKEGVVVSLPMGVANAIQALPCTQALVDGEIIGERYIAFELLELNGEDLRSRKYSERLAALEGLFATAKAPLEVVKTARTTEEKRALRAALVKRRAEGVTYKDFSAPYTPARPASGGSQFKDKFVEDCTVEVVEVGKTKRSVSLACRADASEDRIPLGKVTIPVNAAMPVVGDIVKVQYLYKYAEGSLFQPTFQGPCPDQSQPDRLSQFKVKATVDQDDEIDVVAPEESATPETKPAAKTRRARP